jgi:cytochrome c peroxidase
MQARTGFILLIILLVIQGCKKDDGASGQFDLVLPSHFPEPHYIFENNPYTYDGFFLGRKLFYDPILSVNNTVSCGTCHAPNHAFADHNMPFSFGVFGRRGIRNSPPVFNMLWSTSFMWDGGVNHIEVSSLPAITDENEMAESISNVVQKLQNHEQYPRLFEKAFGTNQVTDQLMFFALAQFMGAIISAESKYDQYVTGKGNLTQQELQGLQLFRTHCSSCHTEPLFTDYSFRNNGLDEEFTDLGRARITLDDNDAGKFKVPTLRNVELTYPYMHDGRFANLDDVLNHYSSGIVSSATLDPSLQGGIPLSESDKAKLKAFLKTLTDINLISNTDLYEQ